MLRVAEHSIRVNAYASDPNFPFTTLMLGYPKSQTPDDCRCWVNKVCVATFRLFNYAIYRELVSIKVYKGPFR